MGGGVGGLVQGRWNTRRADFKGGQPRPSGVMDEVTASNPACGVCNCVHHCRQELRGGYERVRWNRARKNSALRRAAVGHFEDCGL